MKNFEFQKIDELIDLLKIAKEDERIEVINNCAYDFQNQYCIITEDFKDLEVAKNNLIKNVIEDWEHATVECVYFPNHTFYLENRKYTITRFYQINNDIYLDYDRNPDYSYSDDEEINDKILKLKEKNKISMYYSLDCCVLDYAERQIFIELEKIKRSIDYKLNLLKSVERVNKKNGEPFARLEYNFVYKHKTCGGSMTKKIQIVNNYSHYIYVAGTEFYINKFIDNIEDVNECINKNIEDLTRQLNNVKADLKNLHTNYKKLKELKEKEKEFYKNINNYSVFKENYYKI